MAHWLKMKPEEKKLNTKPQPQKWCTQEERQEAYDNWETTDDHGMLIYGIAKDQEGNDYYMVKNSWGKQENTMAYGMPLKHSSVTKP